MKFRIFAVIAAVVTTAAYALPASAACKNVAERCVQNGGEQKVCFGPAYAAAQKTHVYIAPYSHKAFQCKPRHG